ncbi:Transmembrane E3 ubiquitin-protein ligase 1 [Glycine soja]|uniref:RING-type E3 ubiquitin transferase n=1 Tax=Glycine soja TaxID=3848 RepID=A0A0B2NVE9_GLYSO|nr:Transmembrane E3 ubiquitin-protein ligase 1 [Glycine soja]
MVCLGFDMVEVDSQRLKLERRGVGILLRISCGWLVFMLFFSPVAGLRPLRDRTNSWGDEWVFTRKDESDLGPFSQWNISGTYRGNWKFIDTTNASTGFPDIRKINGNSVIELVSMPTKITGVHYVQLGVFSSQVFQEPSQHKMWRRKHSPLHGMEKHCNVEIAAHVSRLSSSKHEGEHDSFQLEGLMESPSVDDDGDCFSPLQLNATSINIEVYYNKAISFLQVLLLIRQMEHSNTQSGAAKVSILMIGQQAIVDAYLCLIHLTAGILVESLFNAFATAAFFKFVVFSIFEMRYLLAIWKASRPLSSGEGWETMRRELSVLYSRFYGILLGGILLMYEFHYHLRLILLLVYSFWIPQIITNVIRDSRKPLHPHYILGITVTRLAIPLYIFGCPDNFLRIEPDQSWCVCLAIFVGLQAAILLLQHYFGSLWFIPRQFLPEKYCYYRRFAQDTNHATDCVICMTAIDISPRSNDCMACECNLGLFKFIFTI